jgi:hypothetical protein
VKEARSLNHRFTRFPELVAWELTLSLSANLSGLNDMVAGQHYHLHLCGSLLRKRHLVTLQLPSLLHPCSPAQPVGVLVPEHAEVHARKQILLVREIAKVAEPHWCRLCP